MLGILGVLFLISIFLMLIGICLMLYGISIIKDVEGKSASVGEIIGISGLVLAFIVSVLIKNSLY